ncbi:MAG: ketopantoate reductase family protein [Dehalococcoidia bacterium]
MTVPCGERDLTGLLAATSGLAMRYVIYGAGAIGAAVGARLTQHGYDAVLIARGAHLEAMQREGVHLRTPNEDFTQPVTAVGHPAEIAWRGDEVVLLTTKTQHTAEALDALRLAAGSNVPVVCAQNGLENERLAARKFARVYSMLVQMPATYLEPGEILLNGVDASGVLPGGRYPAGLDVTIEEVTKALRASEFRSWPEPNPLRLKYAKLVYINLDNAVQATSGASEGAAELARLLIAEAERVLDAAGIDYASWAEFQEAAPLLRGDVPGFDRTAAGSTWQSLFRGAGSIETDYLNGEILLLGTLHGIPTPLNRAVQDRVTRMLVDGTPPRGVAPAEILDLARSYGADL